MEIKYDLSNCNEIAGDKAAADATYLTNNGDPCGGYNDFDYQ